MTDLKNDRPVSAPGGGVADEGLQELPPGLQYVRTTPRFDEICVPRGLLAAHRIAAGVWGRLVVLSGALGFSFEEDPGRPHRLMAGDHIVIPPTRPHHLTLEAAVTFEIEFYKVPADDPSR